MANTKSAAKRARQTIRRTIANKRAVSAVKNLLKRVRTTIAAGKKEEAEAAARLFSSAVDKAAKHGRVHKNKANRHKSKIARSLAALK